MLRWLHRLLARVRVRPAVVDTGSAGELVAARWLEERCGFRILARNWRAPHDRRLEIDLIGREAEALVFVEVKARAANALVPGYFAAVSKRKREALERASRAYVGQLIQKPRTVRFDVVEVLYERGEVAEVRHYENVPLFPKGFLRGR